MVLTKDEWLTSVKDQVSPRNLNLLSRAYDTLAANTVSGPDTPWAPYRCISPWIKYDTGIWNWDTAFHAMATSYFDTELAKDCLRGFMKFQKPDGMFPDVVYLSGSRVEDLTKPPVLPWAALTVYKHDGDADFLRECYPRFVANEKFWVTRRKYNGLFHYSSEGTPEEVAKNNYLHARYESGWDNSPRWDSPVVDYWPIDLNCFMITFYRSMSEIAAVIGEDSGKWKSLEEELTNTVLERLWDPAQQAFLDYDFKRGAHSHVVTPASFMPLFIGIANQEQANAMHRIGADPARFFPGMPSVSYDDPTYSTEYWRGPTWLNLAFFATKGLKNYGFTETADAIREFVLSMVDENKDGIYENYNSKERKGLYWHSFSWSACFVIEFILNW